jgi:hypothetical protein
MLSLLRPLSGPAQLVAVHRRIADACAFKDGECLWNVGTGGAIREAFLGAHDQLAERHTLSRRGWSPTRPVMARTPPHHHGAAIPIEDDDLEPSGRVGKRALGQHRGRVAEDKRRALPGQNNARTDERYPVITISDAILGDSSHHNFACKTFGVQVLSPRSMLGSMSSNPASICNQTRLHSTHLRSGSVRPS